MEQRLRQLIVGYDFAEAAQAAVKAAGFFGRELGSRVRVVTAIRKTEDSKVSELVGERQRDEVKRLLLDDGGGDYPIDFGVEWGATVPALFRAATDYDGDMIIVGARGRRSLDNRGIGPDSERLARRSHLPALLLHPDKAFPPKRILAAVDFSEASERALGWAMDLARLGGGSVDVLHVVERGSESVARLLGKDAPPKDKSDAEATRTQLGEFIKGVRIDVEVQPKLRYGVSSEQILAALDEEPYDLLCISTIGRHAVMETLVGGTTERVLRKVPCSVMTSKPDTFHLKGTRGSKR